MPPNPPSLGVGVRERAMVIRERQGIDIIIFILRERDVLDISEGRRDTFSYISLLCNIQVFVSAYYYL